MSTSKSVVNALTATGALGSKFGMNLPKLLKNKTAKRIVAGKVTRFKYVDNA